MGSTSYLSKSKSNGYKAKSGSSGASDKEMNGKLRRTKIRRPGKITDYGLKRVPDYTELAYKEAVSKLRYFLSGTYAPSLRSYGGSASIKNLDESDQDLDKKYSTYNNLAEFKPRPRLTAKYTTLYADSLKNTYTPQHVSTTPTAATTAADLSGGTNPDVVNFIQKQEEYIEQLERESQYCRDELNNLLGKVKEVISENEHLHEAQKNKLISRMFHSYNAGSETDDLDDIGDSTGLDSDNKLTPSKSRRGKRTTKLEGPNIVFESRIAELEAQLAQAKIDLKKVQDENNDNKRKLASGLVDSTCLDGFKRQIDNLQRDKSSLEAQISKLKITLEKKEGDLGYKRGSDIVEQQLREERNNLEAELRRLKDDLSKERNKVRELAGEGARRAMQERSAAEQRYTAHFDELQHDLAAQYDNAAKLQLELERQRREENDLKRELSMKNAAIEELKMELKNKSSSLQADLAQAHAEKASLEEELASARLAMERQQRQAKHETNRLNSEIQSLRQRLDRADADAVHARRENLRLSEQIAALEKEINMKSLTPNTPEKTKKEREFNTMMESMENKHAKTVAELESMIQSQNSLMEKLTGECRLLTDKLDDANRRHKQELVTMQRQIEQLGRSFQSTPPSTYQAPATHTPSTNRNAEYSEAQSRPDHTRADATRHTTRDEPLTSVKSDRVNGNNYEAPGHKQSIEPSSVTEPTIKTDIPETDKIDTTKEFEIEPEIQNDKPEHEEEYKDKDDNEIMEVEHTQEYEAQNYEQGNYEYDQNYQPNQEYQEQHYDQQADQYQSQNYDQNQPREQTCEQTGEGMEYQNPDYQQNYEQQRYDQTQYENYEQYPQQYVDPNVPIDPNAQYENYATDETYQNQPNYDAANSEYTEELTPQFNEKPKETVEVNKNNSPNSKAPTLS